MTNDLLTVLEASRILGVSPDAVRYQERCGYLHAMRVGTHRIFFRQDVERLKREREADAREKEVAETVVG